MMTQKGDP